MANVIFIKFRIAKKLKKNKTKHEKNKQIKNKTQQQQNKNCDQNLANDTTQNQIK